jgi:hypothetical protein
VANHEFTGSCAASCVGATTKQVTGVAPLRHSGGKGVGWTVDTIPSTDSVYLALAGVRFGTVLTHKQAHSLGAMLFEFTQCGG